MSGSDVPLEERPGLAGAVRRQWPWVVVLGCVGVGLLLVAVGLWRAGLAVVGGAMLLGGALRAALPDPGILAVRSKVVDLFLYVGAGTLLVVFDAIATIDL
jgi:hypothetical protein